MPLIYSYQGFLNSFSFPIQIVMQSRQLDLANYIQKAWRPIKWNHHELIQIQITRLRSVSLTDWFKIANIMNKSSTWWCRLIRRPCITRYVWQAFLTRANRLEVKMSPAEFKGVPPGTFGARQNYYGRFGRRGRPHRPVRHARSDWILYATYNPKKRPKNGWRILKMFTGAYVHPKAAMLRWRSRLSQIKARRRGKHRQSKRTILWHKWCRRRRRVRIQIWNPESRS